MVRTRLVFAVFAILFLIIIIRLFYWQIVVGHSYKALASSQYSQVLTLPSSRGLIISADSSPLVVNQPAYLTYSIPNEIQDKRSFVDKLSTVLPIDKDVIKQNIEMQGRLWVPLAKKIEPQVKDQIMKLQLPGIGFEKEARRYYSESSMAAHLIGFVGKDNDGIDLGYFGIEGFYDRYLRGKNGSLTIQKDPEGQRILLEDTIRIEPENGRTLELWLDKTIQLSVERHLKEGLYRYGAKEGSVVVIDPWSGGILAMASFPAYDPAHYADYASEFFKNPVVASSYEPGSTFKVLVMAEALDLNIVSPHTTLKEAGPVTISGYTIKTWNDQYRGTITATEALTHSSNVGMVAIGEKVGKENMLKLINDLGFGKLTDIDLQDEESPSVREQKLWTDIDIATLTFGQGIAVTPIQMVRAVGAIANGGWLMQPKVVKKIHDEYGKEIEVKPTKVRQVFRPTTSSVVSEMMVTAVENGEAKWAKPKGYRIAGKTGTAQIPVQGHYDEEKTIASFVGFAPSDKPRFVMLVTLREPSSSPWGSETAAPLFFSIAKDIFIYLGIPPT